MRLSNVYGILLGCLSCVLQVRSFGEKVYLSHNGPIVLGGTITFRADLRDSSGNKADGVYMYSWRDDAMPEHSYKTDFIENSTVYWNVSYPSNLYTIGNYEVEVVVHAKFGIIPYVIDSRRIEFEVVDMLNGNLTIQQPNRTEDGLYVSSVAPVSFKINIKNGDAEYIKNATSITTYWFIDCMYHGFRNDFNFEYNFTKVDEAHRIDAVVIASFEPPTTTTVAPITTTAVTPTTTAAPSVTTPSTNSTNTTPPGDKQGVLANITTINDVIPSTTTTIRTTTIQLVTNFTTESPQSNSQTDDMRNFMFPAVCSNSSNISPEHNKTYGYFTRNIHVKAPITNIKTNVTSWIQPWEMLYLNMSWSGSKPFYKCLEFHRGVYNVTGNETCDNGEYLDFSNFSIIHYFLEPSVYTILVILSNDINVVTLPLTINIYKVTTKAQLSVIIVPVTCSLVAVVLIIFGVAYYIQSRARFTIEVADFDFGQSNPDMEYKTFKERLRDSFENAVRPGNKRTSNVRQPNYGSTNQTSNLPSASTCTPFPHMVTNGYKALDEQKLTS